MSTVCTISLFLVLILVPLAHMEGLERARERTDTGESDGFARERSRSVREGMRESKSESIEIELRAKESNTRTQERDRDVDEDYERETRVGDSAVCPTNTILINGSGLSSSKQAAIATLNDTLSWTQCCHTCSAHIGCTAWTYHMSGHHSALQCSLWKTPGTPHISDGAISGTTTPLPPAPIPPTPRPMPTKPPIGPVHPPLGYQPNIVFIQTDDQDVELGGLEPMPKLAKLVGEKGATMKHWYVNTPVCCPSRSETLSGRYHHNIRDSPGPEWKITGCGDEAVGKPHVCGCMRVNTSADFEATTYGTYLQAAGYYTGYFGKYLNPPAMDPYCHNQGTPVPGWNEQLLMCNTAYYDINWVDDSGNINHTGTAPNEYSTSIIGNRTIAFIRSAVALSKPFFVSAATRAPHGPSTPAPWYMHAFAGLTNRITPAYNNTGSGHVGWVQNQAPISDREAGSFDQQYANRWRTLLSVDDLVGDIMDVLKELDIANRTFVFYTSDHGYHLGHLRLNPGKSHFYEFDARVPMLIVGPGVAANSTPGFLAGNVDLAPTFLDLAGVTRPQKMDGRSVLHALINNTNSFRSEFLVEFSGLTGWPKNGARINDCPNNTYRALRIVNSSSGQNMIFSELTSVDDYNYQSPNYHELYDMNADPFQLNNLWYLTNTNDQASLLHRLHKAAACTGEMCP